ncbi:MAG: hypothetical protein KAW47_06785 [Thermoplasmatales archaeon]|nr:hypothetical protein [Thermoplasmatales archaeon]
MGIYINTNGTLREETNDLIHHLKTERRINCCDDRTSTLSEVEEKCSVCVMNLTMFEESKVNLRSGGEIGLSNWFKMLTIAIINPRNEDLKNELENIGVQTFAKEDIVFVLDYISDIIVKTEKHLMNLRENIDIRRIIREVECEDLKDMIAEAFISKRLNRLRKDF